MAAFVQLLRRECGVGLGVQVARKCLGAQKGGRMQCSQIKRAKLQNRFAMCQTLHKSTCGGIQTNKLGTLTTNKLEIYVDNFLGYNLHLSV